LNDLIGTAATILLLLVVGGSIGLFDRARFSPRWLVIAAGLVLLNDLLLTRAEGLLPDLFAASDWNWEGKLLALAGTLAIAALPAFGWHRSGLTLAQARASLRSSIPVLILYCAFFVAIALAFPSDHADADTIAFQLTMPGLEEEPFYRGILLLALDRAFTGRTRLLGVDWGWGAILSCALFGMAHAFGFSHGRFSFDAMTMALTTLPSLIGVWLRLRTGSLLMPVLMHNFGNSISLMV